VTGADTDPTVDGIKFGTNSIQHVRAGQVISFGTPRAGCVRTWRCAAAFAWSRAGSRSYDVMSAIGPSPLQSGDQLPVGQHTNDYPELDRAPWRPLPPM